MSRSRSTLANRISEEAFSAVNRVADTPASHPRLCLPSDHPDVAEKWIAFLDMYFFMALMSLCMFKYILACAASALNTGMPVFSLHAAQAKIFVLFNQVVTQFNAVSEHAVYQRKLRQTRANGSDVNTS